MASKREYEKLRKRRAAIREKRMGVTTIPKIERAQELIQEASEHLADSFDLYDEAMGGGADGSAWDAIAEDLEDLSMDISE